jgi:hypothetical protein
MPGDGASFRGAFERHLENAGSIAAAYPPCDRAAPIVLFLNGDVPAAGSVSAVAPLLTPSIPTTFFVHSGTLLFLTLTPALAALIALPLGIANAELGASVRTEAELNLRLGNGGRDNKKA